MSVMSRPFWPALLLLALAGCATTLDHGEIALRQERYAEAALRFEQALAERPDRLDAVVGLGIARYRLGDFEGARPLLERARAAAPAHPAARLHLGLLHLRAGAVEAADRELAAYTRLDVEPRLARAVDRARRRLTEGPLAPDVRALVAAGLEDQAAWARELRETHRAVRAAELRHLADHRVWFVGGGVHGRCW